MRAILGREAQALDKRIRGVVKFNEELRKYTSLRVGGVARYLVIPKDRADLQEALAFARERGLPWVALGNGTNILFPDEGYPGWC